VGCWGRTERGGPEDLKKQPKMKMKDYLFEYTKNGDALKNGEYQQKSCSRGKPGKKPKRVFHQFNQGGGDKICEPPRS